MTKNSINYGKEDAERFIKNELIDYKPFVAISDMHLVRKTIAVSYETFKKSVEEFDKDLWAAIDNSARKLSENKENFNQDEYAEGFAEGVNAVWEKIRPEVLKSR